MTTFQKWIIAILIIFGAIFLYILKTGFEFFACATTDRTRAFEACYKYFK